MNYWIPQKSVVCTALKPPSIISTGYVTPLEYPQPKKNPAPARAPAAKSKQRR